MPTLARRSTTFRGPTGGIASAPLATRSTTELRKIDARGAKKRLDGVIEENKPSIVAFIGKAGYRYYQDEGLIPLTYGIQREEISKSRVYLLPSTSGASFADTKYSEKLYWYRRLKTCIKKL